MKTQGLIESCNEIGGENPETGTDALNGERPDLVSLSLRVTVKAGARCGQDHLERVDPGHIGRDGNDCDHAFPTRSAEVFAPSLLT